MPIETRSRREAALIDTFGMIHPDGSLAGDERPSMVGQYGFLVQSLAAIPVNLYIEQARTVVTGKYEAQGMKIEQVRSVNLYIEQTRATDLEIL